VVSFLVGARRWAGGKVAIATSICVRSLEVTVSLAVSAKIGSIVGMIELMLIPSIAAATTSYIAVPVTAQ
jgi:hypothetical protein